MEKSTRRIRALPVINFTSFTLSVCFFFGLPLAGRWTCRFIRPGMI